MSPTNSAASKKVQSPMKQGTLSFKTTKRGAVKAPKAKSKPKPKPQTPPSTDSEDEGKGDVNVNEDLPEYAHEVSEALDMRDKSGTYSDYCEEVRSKMGWVAPVHAEGQTKIHHMLRVFDNTYEYGPCVGMTRMERWERAQAMGLNPPIEVRDILLKESEDQNTEFVHPVFYGLVL